MSALWKRVRSHTATVLVAAVLAACSSEGDDNGPNGTISLSLNPTSATVQQGGQTTVTATLTRGGGFTGTVNFTVTGAPTGVTATVGNVQTNGTVTTATVTVAVAPTTAVGGPTTITVRGTATGLTDATATFQLTVTAAGSFTLSATPAGAITIAQGASDNSKTININRTNYTGSVTLTAENLPTGLSASFAPNNTTTNSSVLTLTATAGATVGGPVTITIRGTGPATLLGPGEAADIEATTTITVTITASVTGNFTLTTTPATTVSVPQGTNGNVTVNINRTGGNTSAVTLTATGTLPTGMTLAFAPNNTTANSSTLTITTTGTTPIGTTPVVIHGNATGLAEQTVNLSIVVTVVGTFTLTTTPATSTSVTQGQTGNVTVNINRAGGNTSPITLTATGTLPTGMTLGFAPNNTTANSSTLTITTTGATPVGATPIVIRGNTTGLAEQTVNLTINVTAPGGSGNASISFASCAAADKAVWVAFMDGTGGTWTQLTGVGDVYNFNVTQSKGSIAYVTTGTGTSTIVVQHMTQAELTAAVFNFCPTTPATITVNGTVANLPLGTTALVSYSGATANIFANGPFQITGAKDGDYDVVAYARGLSLGVSDRVFISRDEDPANGQSFVNPVDFTNATRSRPPAAASASLSGLTGSETNVFFGMTFHSTGSTACVPAPLFLNATAAANFTLYGVHPDLRNVAGDMHSINFTVLNGTTSFRLMTEYFLDVATRAATPFVLGAQLPIPNASDAGGPYKRPTVAVTGVPAEYNLSHVMTYSDQTVTGKGGTVTATQGWVGGSNVTLGLPNFSGVGTFQNSWAPATPDNVNWTFSSSGGTFTGGCTAGQKFLSATRTGTI